MSVEGLQIKVGADISNATKGILAITHQIGKLKQTSDVSAAGISKAFDNIGNSVKGSAFSMVRSFQPATAAINQFKQSLKDAPKPIDNANKAIKGANTTLTNFARIAQDAPYGIIGIANNIDPLISSFQSLKRETGSTGGALKALGGSLLGGGGLAIGISVITSLLVAFGDKLFNTASKGESLRKSLDAAKKVAEEFALTLSDTNQARLEGIKNSREELVSLETLYKASQNQNLSLAERKKAVDLLQEQYPKYFQNIKDETILAGGATAAYKSLKEAIIGTAKAKALQDKIVDLSRQNDDISEQGKAAAKDLILAKQDQERIQQRINNMSSAQLAKESTAIINQHQLTAATERTAAARKRLNDLVQQSLTLDSRVNRVGADVEKLVVTNGVDKTLGTPTGNLPKVIKAKEAKVDVDKVAEAFADLMRDIKAAQVNPDFTLVPEIKDGSFIPQYIAGLKQGLENELDRNKINLSPFAQFDADRQLIIEKFTKLMPLLKAQLPALSIDVKFPNNEKLQEGLQNIYDQTVKSAEAINGVLAPAFTSVFDSILAGKPAMESFFQSIGNSIKQLIKQLISAAAQAAILSLITGGTAGFGKRFASNLKIPGFAKGTRNAPPGLKWVGEKGPELMYDKGGYGILSHLQSMNFMKSMAMPNLSALQMPNIGGSIARSMEGMQNHIEPAETNVFIDGNMKISGDELMFLLKRTARRQGRNF